MIHNLPEDEFLSSGHGACQGCPETIMAHIVLKAAGKNTIVINSTSCLEVVTTPYPKTAWKVPWIHSAFQNASAVASGIDSALKIQNKRDKINLLVLCGDGATYDIGLASLSGALERKQKFTYICYDTQSYSNTGFQRSSATPFASWTSTTPIGTKIQGKQEFRKPITEIVAAHNIPYIATASLAYPNDLYEKVKKSFTFDGPSFINVLSPCTLAWKFDPSLTIDISRKAVESGSWVLYEIENGNFKLSVKPKMIPVEEYLKLQGRFSHLTKDKIKMIQEDINNYWKKHNLLF